MQGKNYGQEKGNRDRYAVAGFCLSVCSFSLLTRCFSVFLSAWQCMSSCLLAFSSHFCGFDWRCGCGFSPFCMSVCASVLELMYLLRWSVNRIAVEKRGIGRPFFGGLCI